MLDHSRDELAVLNHRLELLRDGLLLKDAVLLALDRQRDVERRAFRRDDLALERVLREVHLAAVVAVEQDGRDLAEDLDRERRRVRHREGGDCAIEQDGRLGAVDCERRANGQNSVLFVSNGCALGSALPREMALTLPLI